MNNGAEKKETSIAENIKGITDSSIQSYINIGDYETAREILTALKQIIEDKEEQLGEILIDNGEQRLEERFGEDGEKLADIIIDTLRNIQSRLSNEFDEILLLKSNGDEIKSENFYPIYLLSNQQSRKQEDKEQTKKDLESDVDIFIKNSVPEVCEPLEPITIGQGQGTTFDAIIKITDNYILCFNNSEKDMGEIIEATGRDQISIEKEIRALANDLQKVINLDESNFSNR